MNTRMTRINNTNSKLTETVILGGGCFWCLEAVYNRVKGVQLVVSGYAGGTKENPTYEEVCLGNTGHAEVVQVTYDPKLISYKNMLGIFFSIHDPTTRNQQGNDAGTQYRSVIFFMNDKQRDMAESVIKELSEKHIYDNPIVTEVVPLTVFYPAETWHQRYFEKNPNQAYCQLVIAPKVAKFREKYREYYK